MRERNTQRDRDTEKGERQRERSERGCKLESISKCLGWKNPANPELLRLQNVTGDQRGKMRFV